MEIDQQQAPKGQRNPLRPLQQQSSSKNPGTAASKAQALDDTQLAKDRAAFHASRAAAASTNSNAVGMRTAALPAMENMTLKDFEIGKK